MQLLIRRFEHQMVHISLHLKLLDSLFTCLMLKPFLSTLCLAVWMNSSSIRLLSFISSVSLILNDISSADISFTNFFSLSPVV